MTFIQSGGSAVKVQVVEKNRIDVRDFGAKGNGLHDDSEAIRNAVEYAASAGKFVYFPPGRYRVYPSPWWYRIWESVSSKVRYWWWFYRLPSK